MRVDGYSGLQGTGPLEPKKDGAAATSQTQSTAPQPAVDTDHGHDTENSTDTVEISAKARELLAGGAVSSSSGTSTVRPEMVDRARKILQSGTYNDNGILEKTAEKIASMFSSEA